MFGVGNSLQREILCTTYWSFNKPNGDNGVAGQEMYYLDANVAALLSLQQLQNSFRLCVTHGNSIRLCVVYMVEQRTTLSQEFQHAVRLH